MGPQVETLSLARCLRAFPRDLCGVVRACVLLGRAVALSLGVFRRYRFSPLDRRDPSRVFTVFELVATPVLGLGGRLTVMFGADSRGSACSRRSLPGLGRRFYRIGTKAIWLILPVVICLSQRLSHACLSSHCLTVKPRMAH